MATKRGGGKKSKAVMAMNKARRRQGPTTRRDYDYGRPITKAAKAKARMRRKGGSKGKSKEAPVTSMGKRTVAGFTKGGHKIMRVESAKPRIKRPTVAELFGRS